MQDELSPTGIEQSLAGGPVPIPGGRGRCMQCAVQWRADLVCLLAPLSELEGAMVGTDSEGGREAGREEAHHGCSRLQGG